MIKEVLNPDSVAKPIKPTFSQAVKVEGKTLLFISGQVSVDQYGNMGTLLERGIL